MHALLNKCVVCIALCVLMISGASQLGSLFSELPDTASLVIERLTEMGGDLWLGLSHVPPEFQRTAVPIPGAIWLVISGWSFTGWFRGQSGKI